MRSLVDRLLDWICNRLGLSIDLSGDLMTADCPDDAPDPHYRPTPQPIKRTR